MEALTWALLWSLFAVLAMILGASLGLWASARATTSWRSLLTTLALFYAGWVLFLVPVSFILVIIKGVLELVVTLVGLFNDVSALQAVVAGWNAWMWAILLGLGLAYYALTQQLLAAAVDRVGRNDRSAGEYFDYYPLIRDYQRRLDEEWVAPKVDLYEEEEPKEKEPQMHADERR
jgi:hypothetical protein